MHSVLTVLGGSSPATPALIQSLRAAQLAGTLGSMEVRLYGRNSERLQRICDYVMHTMASLPAAASTDAKLDLVPATTLDTALDGASVILCMVRPGGMQGRAADEKLARDAGVPADEGLAVGGLRCFLRGRSLIAHLAQVSARVAPGAHFLQMSSPLGLNVAITRRAFGERAFGLCELPRTTARKLEVIVGAGMRWSRHSHAGLNHQSWLYAFRDSGGRDITDGVLAAIGSGAGLGVTRTRILEHAAIPVNYLRLYLHTRRVLNEQRGTVVRGQALALWSQRVEAALCGGAAPDVPRVTELLAQRTMDWFADGVVPVLEALQSETPSSFVLNVPAAGALPGAANDAIIEIDCEVSSRGAKPQPVPELPAGPARLTRTLLEYEGAALALPLKPTISALSDVLAAHPLTPRRKIHALARALVDVRPEPV